MLQASPQNDEHEGYKLGSADAGPGATLSGDECDILIEFVDDPGIVDRIVAAKRKEEEAKQKAKEKAIENLHKATAKRKADAAKAAAKKKPAAKNAARTNARDEEHHRNLHAMENIFPSLSPEDHNKFALMRNGRIIGTYSDAGDALDEGLLRYSDDMFSIQPITDKPIVIL